MKKLSAASFSYGSSIGTESAKSEKLAAPSQRDCLLTHRQLLDQILADGVSPARLVTHCDRSLRG